MGFSSTVLLENSLLIKNTEVTLGLVKNKIKTQVIISESSQNTKINISLVHQPQGFIFCSVAAGQKCRETCLDVSRYIENVYVTVSYF